MDDATGPLGENWMRNMMYSVIIFKTMFKVMNHFFFTVTVYGFVIVRSICILAPRATGRRGGKKETPWTGSRYSRFLTRWCALVLILGPLCMNRDLWRGPNIRIVEKFRISRKTCVPLFGIQWNQMVLFGIEPCLECMSYKQTDEAWEWIWVSVFEQFNCKCSPWWSGVHDQVETGEQKGMHSYILRDSVIQPIPTPPNLAPE